MLNEMIDITSWYYHDKPCLEEGDELEVRCEPDNEYDDQAIALYKGTRKVGYVPRENTWQVHRTMESGSAIEATVVWPYQEEIDFPPRVLLTDAEARMKIRAEQEKKNKNSIGTGAKLAIYALALVICIAMIWGCVQYLIG